MRLRKAERTILGDVDLLSARHGVVQSGARGGGVQSAGDEDGGVVLEAGAVEPGDAGWAVGGGLLVDPEGLAGGVDLAVVDGRGGADGHECERSVAGGWCWSRGVVS